MGMYSYVRGGKPADQKYKDMALVWSSCTKIGIDVPKEVYNFFNGEEPDGDTIWIDISECVTEESEDGEELFTVDLKKLPSDITLVKFTNSY